MIRVLLADDQALVRGAMAALLRLEEDIDVVSEVGSGADVLSEVARNPVDVCLLDIEMPDGDGIAVAGELALQFPQVRALIVTTFGRPGYVRRALEAGADGFIVKDTPAPELAAAIRVVHAGNRVVDPALAAASLAEGSNPLSTREQDVLRAALTGRSVAAISSALHLSNGTVRNYLSAAIAKTGAANRLEAARAAELRGWI